MKRIAAALALLALVVAAAGCGEKKETVGTPGARSLDLVLDFFPNADHVGLYAGLAEGAFKRVGLDVRVRTPSDPAAPLKLLAAGQADLAISYEPEVLLARDRGLRLVSVAAIVQRPLTSIIALPPGHVRRAADLRGRTVGTAGIPYQDAYLKTILKGARVNPDSVREVNVGFNLVPALLSKRVNAILGGFWNYEGVQLTLQRRHPVVIPVDKAGVPAYDELVVVARKDDLRDRGELVRRFLRGLSAGYESARANPVRAVDELVKANPSLDRRLQLASVRATLPAFFPADRSKPFGYQDAGQWARYGAWMLDNELVQRPPDAGRARTNGFLPGQGLERPGGRPHRRRRQPVLGRKAGGRVHVHPQAVACLQLGDGRPVGRRGGRGQERGQLGEVALEAGGRDQLQQPRGLVPGVPERVPDAPGLEHQLAGAGHHHVLADLDAHASLEHVAVLVLALVDVQRRPQRPRRDRVLDQREAPVGDSAADNEADAQAAELDGLAGVGAEDGGRGGAAGGHRQNPFAEHRVQRLIPSPDMEGKRAYTLRRRAERQAETRRRITEATIELHRTVGPARTTISEVARRAGVQRLTVYNHFPDDASLFAACQGHWLERHPPADPRTWAGIEDPRERVRAALGEVYRRYRETPDMTANVLRDARTVPALGELLDRTMVPAMAAVRDDLLAPWRGRGARRRRIQAALELTLGFEAWRTFAANGLDDDAAAELGARLVEAAATPSR